MPDLFQEESNLFLELLKRYEKNEINLKTVILQCKRMNILFHKEEMNKMRNKIFQFVKNFNDKLNDIENEYRKENSSIDIEDSSGRRESQNSNIEITPKFVQYCAHLGLSQNIPINRTGGLPAYPKRDMLVFEPVEDKSNEAFEF